MRLEAFNERYKSQLKEFEEIALKDQKIEGKYLLLKDELERVASERLNLIKKNESLDNEAEDINKDFKLLDEERKLLFEADKEIDKECEAVNAEFERLSVKKGISTDLPKAGGRSTITLFFLNKLADMSTVPFMNFSNSSILSNAHLHKLTSLTHLTVIAERLSLGDKRFLETFFIVNIALFPPQTTIIPRRR